MSDHDRCPACGYWLGPRPEKTGAQLGYYRGVVLPILSEFTGYELDEMHEELKETFGLPSTATADSGEFSAFLDRVLRWAARCDCPIPPPGAFDKFRDMPSPQTRRPSDDP